jgi:hypothetical protein
VRDSGNEFGAVSLVGIATSWKVAVSSGRDGIFSTVLPAHYARIVMKKNLGQSARPGVFVVMTSRSTNIVVVAQN